MADDKLRDLTPVDIVFVPGERPTDEKLTGMMVQVADGLKFLEDTVGDSFGYNLQTDNMWISNLSRDMGDRSALNPIMMPDQFIAGYVQNLTLGQLEHELDLIPVGSGSTMVSFSSDTSVTPGQFKSTAAELDIPGDWTIAPGMIEKGVIKNSRKLVTHSPSNGGTISFTSVTSGRGSSYVGARHNTIPSIGQAESGGPFLTVTLSDAIENIYTIQLPVENEVSDRAYDSSTSSFSNTASGIGTGFQALLPSWLFDSTGLDMGADAGIGGPKTFPLNTIRVYDFLEKKVVDGLIEVKASSSAANREFEITCQFESSVILDTVTGQYVLVTNGTSLAEMIGALQRDVYFHKHAGDDMIRSITHSDLLQLRTGTTLTTNRSEYYGTSDINNNDHSQYLHRNGFTDTDQGAGANVFRGDLVIGSQDTGSEPDHENYNLLTDSYTTTFGHLTGGGQIYFDKIRVQNLSEGRGNIPQNFSDTALVVKGSLDDGSSSLLTTYVDGNLRVSNDVVLGTDATHDVFVSGDMYIKNSMTLIPRTTGGLTPETGMTIYSSTDNAPIYYNGTAWVNGSSIGYATTVGDGIISFGKYNGTDAATCQAAIDFATAQGGGIVKMLRGSYSYGSTLVTIKDGVVLEGEGSVTSVASTATAYVIDAAAQNAGVTEMAIDASTKAVEIDGSNHRFDGLDISNSTIAFDLLPTSLGVVFGERIKYNSVATKILNQSTAKDNKVVKTKPTAYVNDFYMIDPVNKEESLDQFNLLSGAATMFFNDVSDSAIGRGRFEVTGNGIFTFDQYMPVMPGAGLGGYISLRTSSSAVVDLGFEAYDSDLNLLASNGNFLIDGEFIGTSWEYHQDITVLEGLGAKQFPANTRFIKPKLGVSSNTGSLYFDGLSYFPMNFATISIFS